MHSRSKTHNQRAASLSRTYCGLPGQWWEWSSARPLVVMNANDRHDDHRGGYYDFRMTFVSPVRVRIRLPRQHIRSK